jgi:ribosomal protein L29
MQKKVIRGSVMTGKEVAALRDEELKLELAKGRNELFDLRSKAVTAKVEDTSRFSKVRRDVARLLGEHNKRRAAKAAPKAPVAKAAEKATKVQSISRANTKSRKGSKKAK